MATRRAAYERLASLVLVVVLGVLLVGDVVPLVAHHGVHRHDLWWRILRIVIEVGLVIFYTRQVRRITRAPGTSAPHQPGAPRDTQRPVC